jgi:hypothetical protein
MEVPELLGLSFGGNFGRGLPETTDKGGEV